MKNILLTLCSVLIAGSVAAQSGNFTDYLPLQVGNVWVYGCSCFGNQCGGGARTKIKLTNTVLINGKTYFQIQTTTIQWGYNCACPFLPFSQFIRVDSSTANFLSYTTSGGCSWLANEMLLDSFKARKNDTITYQCQRYNQWQVYKCLDTNNVTIFGGSRQSRTYELQGFEWGGGRTYVKGIGLSHSSYGVLPCLYQSSDLRGCVINGVVYGDTGMIVGIKQISTNTPAGFALGQNYPNPFNANTKITFDAANNGSSPVQIKIFDALGNEIATLVNEALKPGTYEVEWNASDFPSGVYFYTLNAGTFYESKKMILLK